MNCHPACRATVGSETIQKSTVWMNAGGVAENSRWQAPKSAPPPEDGGPIRTPDGVLDELRHPSSTPSGVHCLNLCVRWCRAGALTTGYSPQRRRRSSHVERLGNGEQSPFTAQPRRSSAASKLSRVEAQPRRSSAAPKLGRAEAQPRRSSATQQPSNTATQSQPLSRAMRAASTRLPAPSLLMASER